MHISLQSVRTLVIKLMLKKVFTNDEITQGQMSQESHVTAITLPTQVRNGFLVLMMQMEIQGVMKFEENEESFKCFLNQINRDRQSYIYGEEALFIYNIPQKSKHFLEM